MLNKPTPIHLSIWGYPLTRGITLPCTPGPPPPPEISNPFCLEGMERMHNDPKASGTAHVIYVLLGYILLLAYFFFVRILNLLNLIHHLHL